MALRGLGNRVSESGHAPIGPQTPRAGTGRDRTEETVDCKEINELRDDKGSAETARNRLEGSFGAQERTRTSTVLPAST